MSLINSVRLGIARLYQHPTNKYENIRIEASVEVIYSDTNDDQISMRDQALSELQTLLDILYEEHFPHVK
jgi:hypothetical protein